MQSLASKWGGLIVFPEERYYGESIPSPSYQYMNTQQVLEDYVEFISFIKREYDADACPVIAFGGSYGGTLTTFLRAAYPSAVAGGLASSAPIGYYDPSGWEDHGVDEYTFAGIISGAYADADDDCLSNIWDATDAIEERDVEELVEAFNVCDGTALLPDKSSLFLYGLEGLPQLNYPYQIGDMPGWPVKKVCEILRGAKEGGDVLGAAAEVTAMALGYSLQGDCLPAFEEVRKEWKQELYRVLGRATILTQVTNLRRAPEISLGTDLGTTLGDGRAARRPCTSSAPMARRGGGIREYKFDWEASAVSVCEDAWGSKYGVTPNVDAFAMRYGGYKLGDGKVDISNIIWSTGGLDPWGGGCFHEEFAPEDASERGLYYFTIPLGAHHFDLRGNHEDDPEDVREVRAKEEEIIWGWIREHVQLQ